MLKGQRYYENEIVPLEDIEEQDHALLCLTTNRKCCSNTFTTSGKAIGEWYYPNNTKVPVSSSNSLVYRNRWNGTVRLNKRRGIWLQMQGIFTCEIPDSKETIRNLTIGIFSRGKGECASAS